MIEKKIKFISKVDVSNFLEASLCLYRDDENNCLIKLHEGLDIEIIFSSDDFFTSLCKLRDWIYEKEQLFPMCKGALINVYPSRMSRQMSDGMNAYHLTQQKQATMDDIIDIFEPVKENEMADLSTTKQQTDYFKNWIKSL